MQYPHIIRSFGRRKTNKLSDNKQFLYEQILPKLTLNLPIGDRKITAAELASNEIILEIGFGSGEHICKQSLYNPDKLFIGCEPYINGVAKLLQRIVDHKIENIKIWPDDVNIILNKLSDNMLDKVYILFPDPWPKTRHKKRRIINNNMLNLLVTKLKLGGLLIIATDHDDYKMWIREHLESHSSFAQCDIQEETIMTKYRMKAEKQNIKCEYFYYNKIHNL